MKSSEEWHYLASVWYKHFPQLYKSTISIFLFTSIRYGSDSEESACNSRDLGSIPGFEGAPGVGNGNPLQHSCLENPMDRGLWQAGVHGGHKESDMTEQLTHTRYKQCLHWALCCTRKGYLNNPIVHFRRRQWHPTPVLLPRKSHGWRSLVGCSPWGC